MRRAVSSTRPHALLPGPVQYAVQGFPGYMPDLERLIDDEEACEHLMAGLPVIEAEPSLLGASNHLLTVGRV